MRATSNPPGLEHQGYEFFPPYDETGATVISWEIQVQTAQDFHEACPRDDEACQWRDPLEASGDFRPTMQTVVRINTLNVALRERLLRLTNDMSNLAIAEMGMRKSTDAGGAEMAAGPEPLSEDSAQRLMALTRAWFDIMGMAQASMGTLTGYMPRTADRTAASADYADRPLVERRQNVRHIDFADRRRAG